MASFIEIAGKCAGDALSVDQVWLLSWAAAGRGLWIGDGSVLAVALASGGVKLSWRGAEWFCWCCFVLEVDGEDEG